MQDDDSKALDSLRVGVLTVSDTASKDPTSDLSGPALCNLLLSQPGIFTVECTAIVPDEIDQIQSTVKSWCDKHLDLVLTTGGTGFSKRDVTPEAVLPLFERQASGLSHAMLASSLKITPFASLSRPVAGIRGGTIIATLPGSPKGAKESLEAIVGVLPHAIELLRGGNGRRVHDKLKEQQTASKNEQSLSSGDSSRCSHRLHSHHHHHHHHHHNHGGEHSLLDVTRDASQLPTGIYSPAVAKRARHSPFPMKPVEEALEVIAKYAVRFDPVTRPVDENLVGWVAAKDVTASEPVPGYRASIVDGYAVIASDGPGVYPVVGVSLATSESSESAGSTSLKPGQIARITTGGAVPAGATAVVMVEDTLLKKSSPDGKQEISVEILRQPREGENIREVGLDCKVGEVVLHTGEIISSVGGEVGVLASVGVREISVFGRPVVGIMSSGDEIVDHSSTLKLKYGQVRDSNRLSLMTLVKSAGFEVVDLGIASDDALDLENRLKNAVSRVDVLITTGGVSMGEMDLLKPMLEQKLGATLHFGRVNLKPGKPTTFATLPSSETDPNSNSKLVFALPGNPVSALVCFYVFVLPALRKMAGYEQWKLPELKVELGHAVRLDPVRPEFHRVVLIPSRTQPSHFVAHSTGAQQSSRLLSMRSATALLKLPASSPGTSELPAGTMVDAVIIGSMV
ncbi:uncharacterized protein VTP21DRAFT_5078 [Calcarisporiella thermophila]|uniref:uncharacterized protein n=1 Tax=Calcarisporiella thermophila TaxID=911321 RepID=UPI00374394F0